MASETRPRGREAATTLGLIVVCALVFAVTFALAMVERPDAAALLRSSWSLDSPAAFDRTGGLVMTRIWLDGQWWRILTAGFVHGSWLHLALNGWALWVVGQWTERGWGWRGHLAVFVLSSVGGCLASLAWVEAPIVVGASAGIFGLAGGLVVARRFGEAPLQRRLAPVASGRLAFWLAVWLIVGWQLPMLANAGHAGGLLVGCAAGLALSRKAWIPRIVGSGLAVAFLCIFALVGRAPESRANYHAFLGFHWIEAGDVDRAGPALERALELRPNDPVLQNAVAYNLSLGGEQLDWALELVQAALAEDPESPDYLDTLGWIYCRQGRVDEGLDALRRAEAASTTSIPEIAEHLESCGAAVIR